MWSEKPIIGFDTETTDVNPQAARLVTASIVVVNETEIEKHYWLADPGVEIPEASQKVHGISTEQAQKEGRPIEEVLEEVAQLLYEHLRQNHVLVAFNASYDLTLLEAELRRHDLPTLEERLGRNLAPIIDPYLLDKVVDKYRKGKRNLESVAQHYEVWDADDFHNAEADVLVTLRVLGAMLRRYPKISQESLEVLMEQQLERYNESAEYFRKKAAERGQAYTEKTGWPLVRE